MKGADKVWRLVEDGAPGIFKVQGQIDEPTGYGPRHIAVRGVSNCVETHWWFITLFPPQGTCSIPSTNSAAP